MTEPSRQPMTAAELALRNAALEYHRSPVRGKISVVATKPLASGRDLSLAYSPGKSDQGFSVLHQLKLFKLP